ncbi:MAG: hypothetical protein ACO2OY_01605, partial [Thermodesulfobacteriaceae bacterium]
AHDFNNLLSSVFTKLYNELSQSLNQLKILERKLLTLVRGQPLASCSNYQVEYTLEEGFPK